MGRAAWSAPDRGASARHSERARGRRGRMPPRTRATDALLLFGRKLEAAAPRAQVLDAALAPFPGGGTVGADGPERPAPDDRPARGAAAGCSGGVRPDRQQYGR